MSAITVGSADASQPADGPLRSQWTAAGQTIRVLLVDPQRLVRSGCRSILSAAADIEVVGEAADGRQAVAMAKELRPDIVMTDVALPGWNGIEATRRLLEEVPQARVLVLTASDSSIHVRAMLTAGAMGYVLKDISDEDLVTAVRLVSKGKAYLSPDISKLVLHEYRRQVINPLDLLTSREMEILQLLAEGRTNKEVAAILNLSVHTVDAHRGKVMEKLNLHSIGDIVRFAMRSGVIA